MIYKDKHIGKESRPKRLCPESFKKLKTTSETEPYEQYFIQSVYFFKTFKNNLGFLFSILYTNFQVRIVLL